MYDENEIRSTLENIHKTSVFVSDSGINKKKLLI